LEIAINTGSLSTNTLEAFDRAAALGFRAVEVNLQQGELKYDYYRKVDFEFYQRLAGEAGARGLRVTSVHSLALNGAQAFSSQARGAILAAAARIAGLLGARALVAHPADLFTGHEALEDYFAGGQKVAPPLVAGFDEAWAQLANRRTALAVENVNYWHRTQGTNALERLQRVIVDLGVHCVLDVRRALPASGATDALARWVAAVGPRTVLVHAHAASASAEHQPPLGPEWAEYAPLFRQTAAKACVLEVDGAHGDDKLIESREYFESITTVKHEDVNT
jgi:hypothetical protein